MKAVLISIQPKWVEKIASGKKTIEVRKSRPKLETPFKVYIYATWNGGKKEILVKQDGLLFCEDCRKANGLQRASGKVIGEFICDRIYTAVPDYHPPMAKFFNYDFYADNGERLEDCLTSEQLSRYGDGMPLYGWHISALKIYARLYKGGG